VSSAPAPNPGATEKPPVRLSVVVAAHSAPAQIGRCLESLEAQRQDGIGEIVVVTAGGADFADDVRRRFPSVDVVPRQPQALTPELWGEGVRHSREAVIALTTTDMLAEPGWARALLTQYEHEAWSAVGGVILPMPGLGPLDAAIYWLRYYRFGPRVAGGAVHDIAGDNGSYRRDALGPYLERISRDGFWENELNQDLVAAGATLLLEPTAVMRYAGESFGLFARQRLVHGRRFGIERFERTTGLRRWLLLLAWPLTPAALLSRVVRGVLAAGAFSSLIPALLPLVGLVACWSSGELLGYLAAAAHAGRQPPLAKRSAGTA
jgi:hypothetical protein